MKSTKSGRVCTVCRKVKSDLEFPSLRADTCTSCIETDKEIEKIAPKVKRVKKSAPPEPKPEPKLATKPVVASDTVEEGDEPVDPANIFVKADAEIDYADPSAKELAARILARRKLLNFIKRFKPKYMAGWVHEDICRRLERFVKDVEEMKEPRLLLCMPVRHGKSEIGSRHLAPWVLGHHPDWEIIAAAGAQSLATSFSRYIRDLVRSDSYAALFPEMRLDPSSTSVENWNTASGGGYLAAGVGTMITGRGANILMIDDPVKDAEAADSQVIRDNIWEWYISTALSRLAPGGGVLVIMCMTGDTPVMMADGSQRRLDSLTRGDEIATYAGGILARTEVKGVRSNGRDAVFKMTMASGKIVRANQRHPFLTVLPNGGVAWVRLKNLTSASRIVTVKGSGANGEALPALPRGATSLPHVADYASVTTEKSTGHPGIVHPRTTTSHEDRRDSSIATASPQKSTTPCTLLKMAAALFVASTLRPVIRRLIGRASSRLTTATTQERLGGCSATTATQESGTSLLSRWHLPPLHISDFTLDEVVSIEPDGEAEVFDVQVDHTENFIANGLVSHNTWWNEDDLAGRLQLVSEMGDGDVFEVVKYPAINDRGDEYIMPDDSIKQLPPGSDVPEGARLTRPHNTALHPERYTLASLLKRKATYYALGQQRWWSAIYQQSPSPDEGAYFSKEMFQFYSTAPDCRDLYVYQAWDFAISTGKESDYTVGVTIGVDHRNGAHVLDVLRFKSSDGIKIAETMVEYARQWDVVCVGFEDGQIWKSISTTFLKACEEKKFWPSYEVLPPLTDKLVRASPLRGRMQSGKVFFDKKAPWWTDLEHELLRFPAGKHDDQIDALAWCIRLLLGRTAPKQKDFAPKKVKSWRDRLKGMMGADRTHMSA